MDDIDRIRSFNRAWTEVLGLLDQGLLRTDHSLAEARVLFELGQADRWDRSGLRERLGMDASFLTRVLTRLEQAGLVTQTPSPDDGRALVLELTGTGRTAATELDSRSADQIAGLIADLTPDQRRLLTDSMTVIRHLTRPASTPGADAGRDGVEIRPVRPGDLGWVVQRNAEIYHDEYAWNADYEVLVARIVADFHDGFDPDRHRAWIAEVGGTRVGCVFCCTHDDDTAQLRILLVEPWARGLGIGSLLVETCIDFATAAGYRRMMLWTNDVLVAARRIYQGIGFELVEEEPHHSFGHDLVGQIWELDLSRRRASPSTSGRVGV